MSINCGGNDYTAVDGTKWTSDYYYTGGDLLYTGDAIVNSQDMPVYRSGRAGLYGDFGYSIPVQNGSYTVTLHFAEIQYWNRGDRVFNVAINGSPVLTNFDILTQVGPRMAMKQQFPVTVTNGMIQIDVKGVVRKGLLNGIQIASSSTTPIAPASLTLSSSALSFSGTAGGSNPAAQTVNVSNAGGGTMSWSASSNQAWLTVSPASGSNAGTLSIGTNLSGMAAGPYSGTITVSAAGATGSPKTIAVSLTVAAPAPPVMTLSSASLSFSGTAGGSNPAAQTVNVSNTGSGTMSWSASSNQAWLTVSPASGSNAGTLSIGTNLSGMAAGPYSGTITVSAAGATGSPKTIAVNLTVAAPAPPVMTLSSASLSFSGTAGGSNPAAQTVNVSNTGSGTMSWSASSNQAWLTVSPASGSNAGTLSIGSEPERYGGRPLLGHDHGERGRRDRVAENDRRQPDGSRAGSSGDDALRGPDGHDAELHRRLESGQSAGYDQHDRFSGVDRIQDQALGYAVADLRHGKHEPLGGRLDGRNGRRHVLRHDHDQR